MKWTDVFDIAIALEDAYPEIDILSLSFPKLRDMVLSLPDFDDRVERCNERVLEAIQMTWVDERA